MSVFDPCLSPKERIALLLRREMASGPEAARREGRTGEQAAYAEELRHPSKREPRHFLYVLREIKTTEETEP